MSGAARSWPTLTGAEPIVIAHRGASGYRPEHTLEAYALAIDMGADCIAPDLDMTKDRVLVTRHENALATVDLATGALVEATTNVHEVAAFASRRGTKLIDGRRITGWFSEDFTLDELKTLRARERLPRVRPANVAYDDRYAIPTLQEVIDLAKAKSLACGRAIGIYPEIKHPSYHASVGLAMEDALVKCLDANGLNHADAPVYVQSFEVANLRYLRSITDVKLVQLLLATERPWDFTVAGDVRNYADLASAAGLGDIARYAHVVAPEKSLVIATTQDGRASVQPFVGDAHAAGLLVHPWTFRTENAFLPAALRRGANPTDTGDGAGEIASFLVAGIDGFFTDHPDVGAQALRTFRS